MRQEDSGLLSYCLTDTTDLPSTTTAVLHRTACAALVRIGWVVGIVLDQCHARNRKCGCSTKSLTQVQSDGKARPLISNMSSIHLDGTPDRLIPFAAPTAALKRSAAIDVQKKTREL